MTKRLFSSRGFTLLEVLIALAILALLGSALAKQVSSSTQVNYRVDQKALALMLAENALEETNLSGWPALGRQSVSENMSDQPLIVEMYVESTSRADMRKITVSVHEPNDETPLAELHSFLGRY